jgi:hypothetical protein
MGDNDEMSVTKQDMQKIEKSQSQNLIVELGMAALRSVV